MLPQRHKQGNAELLLDIAFGANGNSERYVLDGWGHVEDGHRWTLGRESRVRLPLSEGPVGCVPACCVPACCVIVIDVIPYIRLPDLPGQAIMLALNGRLLTTIQLSDSRIFALQVPADVTRLRGDPVLTITNLMAGVPRDHGLADDGRPLGIMVLGITVCQVPPPAPASRAPLPDGRAAVEQATGMTLPALASHFECLGQGCEFGLVQRQAGIEPLGLLRFADTSTPKLVHGLSAGYEGIGVRDTMTLYRFDESEPRYKLHDQFYYLWYLIGSFPNSVPPAHILRDQRRRLAFLREKFVEDLGRGDKIFVLTRGGCLTEAEALAVFCALNRHGPNTLLWTVHGDPAAAGRVDRLRPGFLCGHLGTVDADNYARFDVWVSVMVNAWLFKEGLLF
jgi:hypothetical protein